MEGTFSAAEAKLAAALVEISGHVVAPIGIVIDLRAQHAELRSTGNLSLAVSLELPAATTWQEAERRVGAPSPELLKAPRRCSATSSAASTATPGGTTS